LPSARLVRPRSWSSGSFISLLRADGNSLRRTAVVSAGTLRHLLFRSQRRRRSRWRIGMHGSTRGIRVRRQAGGFGGRARSSCSGV
ncbi:hypothetical protein KEM56_002291, partial [Ascosphaera pollenicola]